MNWTRFVVHSTLIALGWVNRILFCALEMERVLPVWRMAACDYSVWRTLNCTALHDVGPFLYFCIFASSIFMYFVFHKYTYIWCSVRRYSKCKKHFTTRTFLQIWRNAESDCTSPQCILYHLCFVFLYFGFLYFFISFIIRSRFGETPLWRLYEISLDT